MTMKSTNIIVLCLMLALAGGAVSADEHINNMCQLPFSQDGWDDSCITDDFWIAGWYVYRYGTAWTTANRSHLQQFLAIFPSVGPKGTVESRPRGSSAKSSGPLPTVRTTAGSIVTTFPDDMTVAVFENSDGHLISITTLPEDGSTVEYNYTTKVRVETNGVTGAVTSRSTN